MSNRVLAVSNVGTGLIDAKRSPQSSPPDLAHSSAALIDAASRGLFNSPKVASDGDFT